MCLTFSTTSTTGYSIGWASLESSVNIFPDRCCTVALIWVNPSLVALSRFSPSTFILFVIFLFPYPEWSRYKYAKVLPNLQSILNSFTTFWMFFCRLICVIFGDVVNNKYVISYHKQIKEFRGSSKQSIPDILSQANFKMFALPNEFSFLGK